MSTTTNAPAESGRDGWVMAGMLVASVSAAVASFTGLRGLALVSGWPWQMAWLLPITLDAYAMTAARVWLAGTTRSRRARNFARANAIGAITASIAGNATYHSVAAGVLHITWPVVVAVGAVPAAVQGLTAQLHALRSLQDPESGTGDGARDGKSGEESGSESGTGDRTGSGTESRTQDGTSGGGGRPAESGPTPQPRPRASALRKPKSRTEDELWAAAREADAAYRAGHDGKPIPRDTLRAALSIAGPKATELRRRLIEPEAAERTEQSDQTEAEPQTDRAATESDRKEAVPA